MKNFDWRTITTLITGYGYVGVPVEMWGQGDDVFQYERLAKGMSHVMGVDGRMTVSTSADNSVKVVWKLSQLSPTNAVLSKMFNAQQAKGFFSGVNMSFQDARRQDFAVTTIGYIEDHVPIKRGGKAVETEWTLIFEVGHIELGDPTFAGTPAVIAEMLGAA